MTCQYSTPVPLCAEPHKKSPVREELHRAFDHDPRLGGGVPLIAVTDREEVIGYRNKIILRRTKCKRFYVRRNINCVA